jgi:pimeloyl-ACP methyl ester carboxylesterase
MKENDMKLILLPGMDGTGKLFQPFISELPGDIDCSIISYPENECLSYKELEAYVLEKLPKDDDYILLAESFSGPIGYLLAKRNLANMKGVIFVATFLQSPKRLLVNLGKLMPFSLLLALPIPEFIIKQFFLGKNPTNHIISLFNETIKNISGKVLSFRIKEISKLSLNLEKVEIKSFYIQALNDRLVSSNNLISFTKISDILKTIKINGPHFILQTKPRECAEFVANEIRLISRQSS